MGNAKETVVHRRRFNLAAEKTKAMAAQKQQWVALLHSCRAYRIRCLAEDATGPDLSSAERLALVRGRATRIREIRRDLER